MKKKVAKKAARPAAPKAVRKLTKVGGGKSYALSVPHEVVKRFGWKERQKLTVTVDLANHKLIIRDWKGK